MREEKLTWRGIVFMAYRATWRSFGLVLFLFCGLSTDVGLCAEISTYDSDRTTGRHLTLDEIVVSGDSVTETQCTELGSRKIEKGRNITLPDVLKHEPDIDLRRRALVGDSGDSLAIRGFSGGRIMLNINGRPVNAAGVWGASIIDWSTIPLDNIEKVELIKGGSSVKYGNNALGGVVNVVTKKPTEKPTLTFLGTYGSSADINSMQNYRLTHSYKIGPVGYSLAGSYQKSDPYLWNNDFKARNLASTVYIDMPFHGQLTLGCQYANSDRGYIMANRRSNDPYSPDFYTKLNSEYPLAFGDTFSPYSGFAYMPGVGATSDKTKTYWDLGYSQPFQSALLEMKLYRNYEESHEKNYARHDINPAYLDGRLVLDRKVESDRSSGGSLELSAVLGDHELLSGLERKILAYGDVTTNYVDLNYNVTNYMPWVSSASNVAKPNTEGQCWGYYLQDSWHLNERWLLTAGIRYDSYKNKPVYGDPSPLMRDDGWSPKLTASYQLSRQDTLTASIYQAMRTPGVGEAYWWAYGATHGVPKLKPEKNNAGELLYMHTFSEADFARVSAYYYDIEDYIMMRFDPNWRGVYNMDSVEVYGLSLDGKLALADWLSANGAVSYQKSEKKGDVHDTYRLTDELDYLPQWKASVGADVMLPFKSVFSFGLRYVGERKTLYNYQDAAKKPQCALINLDSYLTADISLKVPVGKHAEFSCYAENLFSEDYEERFGYPMPGVVVGAAIKLSL